MAHVALAQYGRALHQYGGFTETVPSITIQFDQFQDFYQNCIENQDADYITGFLTIFMQSFYQKYKALQAQQIEQFKKVLIQCLEIHFPNIHLAHQFTTIIAWVFKEFNGNWPELINFIENKSDSNIDVSGFILSKILPYSLPEFKSKIYDLMIKLLPVASIPVKLRLLFITSELDSIVYTADFWILLWTTSIECIKQEATNEKIIWTILSRLQRNLPTTSKIEPPRIENDSDYLYLVTLIGILLPVDFYRALNRIVTITSKMIVSDSKSGSLGNPLSIFDSIKLVNWRKITHEQRLKAIDVLRNAGENRDAALFVILPFLPEAINFGITLEDIGLNFLYDLSIGTVDQQQLYCRSICILARSLTNTHAVPSNCQTALMSIAQSLNEQSSQLAFDAIESLLECYLFSTPESLKNLFFGTVNFSEKQKCLFLRSLQGLIECGCFELSLLSPIEEYMQEILRNAPSLEMKASIVSLISSFASIRINIIQPYVKEVLPFITTIVNSKKCELIPDAARLLMLFCIVQPALSRRTLTNLYPKLLDFVKTEKEGHDVHRGRVGESIAGLVDTTLKKKEMPELMNIISMFLSSNSNSLLFSALNMIHTVIKLLSQAMATTLYSELARLVLRTDNEKLINIAFNTMKKLFGPFQMNKNSTVRFLYLMLTECHPLFVKQSIRNWSCPNTSFFPFVTFIIEKIPKDVTILIPIIDDICKNASDEMFTVIFDMVAAAFSVGLVNELPSKRLYDVCYKDIFNHHSTIALGYVIEKITDKLSELTSKLQIEWNSIKMDQMFWKCAVSDALVQLVARKQEIDIKILEKILEDFPFRPEFGFCEEIALHLMEAFQMNSEFCRPLELQYVKALSDFFMYEKSDFMAFRVGYNTQMEMKDEIRRIVKGAPNIEKEMRNYYSKNKMRLNTFLSFLQ